MNDEQEVWFPLAGIVTAAIIFTLAIQYMKSAQKSRLINEAYGTRYTALEIMWNSKTIEQTLLGQKQRLSIELKAEGR